MAYDEKLAERVWTILKRRRGVGKIKMFGGLCFTINGNMSVGVAGDCLVLRLGEEGVLAALDRAHTRPFDMTGKVLRTMVYVDPPGFRSAQALRGWVDKSVGFARTLPPK